MIRSPQLAHAKPYDIRIWQCTDFGRHWHSSSEIYICLHGQLQIWVEGTMYRLTADDTVFVASNEAHEIFCDTPNTRVILISFGYDLLGSDYDALQDIALDVPCFSMKDSAISSRILEPLRQIRDAMCRADRDAAPTDWIFRSSLYAIAAYICRHKREIPRTAERSLRARQLEKISGTMQYIAEHFRESITVEQAATMAGYDRSYFCKQFRAATGMTFHRYLNYYRICVACQLLTDTKLPLSVAAERAGFPTQKNLSRLFRDLLGMTPSQYKKLPPEVKYTLRPL